MGQLFGFRTKRLMPRALPPNQTDKSRHRILVEGVVQGVGFRPFVYNLARRFALHGSVHNASTGVVIEAQGPASSLVQFEDALRNEAPPNAIVEEVKTYVIPFDKEDLAPFSILNSSREHGTNTLVGVDTSICDQCAQELYDPNDRRFRYPFINCVNCGPRYTIIQEMPYDRPFTTMSGFEMCADCRAEYEDPSSRRFHAQPIACPQCGPKIWLEALHEENGLPYSVDSGVDIYETVANRLRAGQIAAIKGLGGFHLACDPFQNDVVQTLRRRKGRNDKPFAVMARDIETVKRFAHVSDAEADLLQSREKPILLLRKNDAYDLAEQVSPDNSLIGVMLPYAPLHLLLLDQSPVLVMTSANLSGEPIVADNQEARQRLNRLADLFLMHNREIENRCDDSVVRVVQIKEVQVPDILPIRRARGYAPFPVRLPHYVPPVLAVGGDLKATYCLTKGGHAFMGPHIGDMVNVETVEAFEQSIQKCISLFQLEPEELVCDMHPGYFSAGWLERYAQGRPLIRVQHHHAHLAAVMAENRLSGAEPLIGFAFDGTGYGSDGAVWGGEIMIADYTDFKRPFHLEYVPLPGGDAAIERPYRMALAHLYAAGIPWDRDLPLFEMVSEQEKQLLRQQLEKSINTAPTSSMGRLFDAVAALVGLRQVVSYEGQAAIELEACADPLETDAYQFEIAAHTFSATPVMAAIVEDLRMGRSASTISARFHNGLVNLMVELSCHLRFQTGIDRVGLSGGVFQNVRLLSRAVNALHAAGFHTYTHHLVPPNDGGLALGQAMIGACKID